MTKIKNTNAYPFDVTISDLDYVIGSDGDNLGKITRNYNIGDLRRYINSGLSPIEGGTLRISEIAYIGLSETPEYVVNELEPDYQVLAYHLVFVKVNGQQFLLKPQNRFIGSTSTPVTSEDFIEFPVSVGPEGPEGPEGNGIASIDLTNTSGLVKTYTITFTDDSTFEFYVSDGANGTNGTDYTANNLQKTITGDITLSNSDNNYTIIINNGTSTLNITVPTGLSDKIAIGFIQQGAGDVTFMESGTTINSPSDYLKIKGQNHACFLEKVGSSEVYQLIGNLKA